MDSAKSSLSHEPDSETVLDAEGVSVAWHEVVQQVNSSSPGSGGSQTFGKESHTLPSSCSSPALQPEHFLCVSTAPSADGSLPSPESAVASYNQVEESDIILSEPEPTGQFSDNDFPTKCTQSASSSSPVKQSRSKAEMGPLSLKCLLAQAVSQLP